jgi:hypothetical protein
VEGMRLELGLPPDSTFLSGVIYEGILYILTNVKEGSFNLDWAELPVDFLCRAYDSIDEDRVESLSIVLTGNDKIDKFLESLGIKERPSKKTYRELLKLLKRQCRSIPINRDKIVVRAEIKGKNMSLDAGKSILAAPQLFKVDRYTGLSTAEMKTTSEQLGLRASPEIILIGLLGVYSSHITTVRSQDSTHHYFLFLSPDEVTSVLASGDPFKLTNIYSVKESLRKLLSETLPSSAVSEVMVLEVMLSTKIRSELMKMNLDKVDFNVFKIAPEGMTYKIYETVPISVYREPMFYTVLSRRGVKVDKLCEELHEALSPGKAIMKALASFNSRNKYSEADTILRGVLDLYKFVSTADTQGLFGFLRSLEESCVILRDDKRARSRIEEYASIQRKISYAL